MCIASSPGYLSQHTENRGNLEKFTSCIYLEKKSISTIHYFVNQFINYFVVECFLFRDISLNENTNSRTI
jgi:hypothetical protein